MVIKVQYQSNSERFVAMQFSLSVHSLPSIGNNELDIRFHNRPFVDKYTKNNVDLEHHVYGINLCIFLLQFKSF